MTFFVFLYITQILPIIFPMTQFSFWNNFLYYVLCTVMFHRRNTNCAHTVAMLMYWLNAVVLAGMFILDIYVRRAATSI